MARPEEGYPAATDSQICQYCHGWGMGTHPASFEFSITCFPCGCTGRGRAYRWYEPIKILPPRTRRRPDPIRRRPADPGKIGYIDAAEWDEWDEERDREAAALKRALRGRTWEEVFRKSGR